MRLVILSANKFPDDQYRLDIAETHTSQTIMLSTNSNFKYLAPKATIDKKESFVVTRFKCQEDCMIGELDGEEWSREVTRSND